MSAGSSVSVDRYVFDVLMRDLLAHDHQPSAYLVYLWLYAQTCALSPEKSFSVGLRGIAEATGLAKSSVQVAITVLLRRKLISRSLQRTPAPPLYEVLRPWQRRFVCSPTAPVAKRSLCPQPSRKRSLSRKNSP